MATCKIVDQVVLGNFSTDENKEYCDDHRNRKFYVEPDDHPDFDLTDGLDDYRAQDPVRGLPGPKDSPLILQWMRDHCDELEQNGILVQHPGKSYRRLNLDFVTRDCVMLALLRAAYKPRRYDMLVTLHRGTYYIEDYQLIGIPPPENCINNTRLQLFATPKFTQLVTSDDGYRRDSDLPVNANELYFEVLKATCAREKLLYSVGVHAEHKDSKERPPNNYVIVKTLTERKPSRFKSLDWWARCYLAGIPEIVCGLRDHNPRIITEVVTYKHEDLTHLFDWKPEVCLMKMRSLLADIKEKVQDDDPKSVYHLYWEEDYENGSGHDGWVERLCNRKLILKGKIADDYVILQDWYLKGVLREE